MAQKKYARISEYGDLLVPMSLLEKIVSECKIVGTSYDEKSSEQVISSVKSITRVNFHNQGELEAAEIQQKLEGSAT